MSFESFIEEIEELTVLPILEKQEGGFFYPEEMQGNLYHYRDSLMHITATSTDEIQLPLIKAIYGSLESGIVGDVKAAISELSNNSELKVVSDKVEELESKLERFLESSEDDITNLINTTSANTQDLAAFKGKSQNISLEMIQKIIDNKFNDIPARVGKIKISTLSMLKESGFSIEEIGELAKNELI